MKKWDSVAVSLQKEDFDISDAQCLFDAIIEQYPNMAKYLAKDAAIKHSPEFESAIVKIAEGKKPDLTIDERDAVEHLKKTNVSQNENGNEVEDDFATSLLKKKKSTNKSADSVYQDVRYLRPTSNMAERFFSKAGFAFGDLRQSILPMNLEMQLILNINNQFWSKTDVAKAMNENQLIAIN